MEARAFGKWLGEVTGVPVEFFDERFTTAEADELLSAAEADQEDSGRPAAINWPHKSCSRPISKRAHAARTRRARSID